MTHTNTDTQRAQEGLTLVEVTMAILVFTVISLPVAITMLRGMEHRRNSFQKYRALSAARNFLAEMQETANLPQNLSAQKGIGAIYSKYHNKSFTVPDLPSGSISITCFANEATVPANLGGPQDLNFDGDAADNLANQAFGTDLRLVPAALTVTFTEGGVTYSFTANYLITKTSL